VLIYQSCHWISNPILSQFGLSSITSRQRYLIVFWQCTSDHSIRCPTGFGRTCDGPAVGFGGGAVEGVAVRRYVEHRRRQDSPRPSGEIPGNDPPWIIGLKVHLGPSSPIWGKLGDCFSPLSQLFNGSLFRYSMVISSPHFIRHKIRRRHEIRVFPLLGSKQCLQEKICPLFLSICFLFEGY